MSGPSRQELELAAKLELASAWASLEEELASEVANALDRRLTGDRRSHTPARQTTEPALLVHGARP